MYITSCHNHPLKKTHNNIYKVLPYHPSFSSTDIEKGEKKKKMKRKYRYLFVYIYKFPHVVLNTGSQIALLLLLLLRTHICHFSLLLFSLSLSLFVSFCCVRKKEKLVQPIPFFSTPSRCILKVYGPEKGKIHMHMSIYRIIFVYCIK